jgi:transaldolase
MTPYQALTASRFGKGYVSLFANRMLDSHILDLAGHSLEQITTNPDWKKLVAEAKEKHFEEAWYRTLNQISYVASELDNNPDSDLIVGSIRSPKDIYRLIHACPQVITIPTKIVRGLENIPGLKEVPRTIQGKKVDIGCSISHPMTQYTLEEFEKAADCYRK